MGTPAWSDAVRAASAGVTLDVEVVPGADQTHFPAGYDPWRKRFKVHLAAPATEGRANDELVRCIAAFFSVPTASVHLAGGATSRRKQVAVTGVDRDQALERIREALDGT